MKTINQILIVLIICTCACGNRNKKVPESLPINESAENLIVDSTSGAYFNKGKENEYLKNYDEAIVYYTKCINLDNDNLDAYFRRGFSKSKLGDKTSAIDDYNYIIDYTGTSVLHYPDLATVYNNKAYCLVNLGDYDTALPLVNKALELNSHHWYIWDTRGELHYHKGLYKKCIDDMTKAISLNKYGNSYYYRGLAKNKLNGKASGYDDLHEAAAFGSEEAKNAIKKFYDETFYLNRIIANFFKYRDEDRLFEGSKGYGFLDMQDSDTLLIFNFDNKTVKKVKREPDKKNEPDIVFFKETTITGDFNGDGRKDTLKTDRMNIVFSDKTIPKLEVVGDCLEHSIKNLGDLDGDGRDEIGIIPCIHGSGVFYSVYSLKNNKWVKMIELSLTRDMLPAGIVPVEKDPEQEGVFYTRSPVEDTPVCCTSYVVEKTIKVKL